ncbi:MAG: LLM class flavin-dependent oxidoreductase [Candidatus Bathyarchaeota archaeon]|nr:LLM class flavin-dependent oxidoreductase [Candidatus Bathyarchaeota archaeon]MDH5745468.1 LLM class flavin-dependent oxidoreductase [Candidatus Bathyarchaeota archaeon]
MELTESNIRFGCFLPIPATPVEKLFRIAKVNEEAGFDSIWVPDHILFIPPGIVPEAWSTLAATATVTEKAALGTCVTDPHRYHPAVLAQKVATVDQISGGRVILGLGAGEAMNLEPFGIEWKKPISKLVEAVTIMRKLWSGEVLNYEGRFWRLKDAFLQINPVKGRVPIYFGANGPRTLRLTGEMADGWLSIPLSPRLYKERLKLVKEGAGKAGRSLDDIDTGVYLYTSVTEKAEDAYKQIEKIRSQVIPSPDLLREAGYDIELPEELQSISYFKALLNSEWVEKFLAYGELIPTEAAIEFSIAGTVEDCINKIDEFTKAGVKHFLLLNVGPDPRQVMKAYSEEIIPYFKSK